MRSFSLAYLSFFLILSCSLPEQQQREQAVISDFQPRYAKGFSLRSTEAGTFLTIVHPNRPGDTLYQLPLSTGSARLACLSTTHVAGVDLLSGWDQLLAAGFADRLLQTEAVARLSDGRLRNLSTSEDADMEILLALDPDVFLVYPFGNVAYDRLEKAGIRCLPVCEYLEESPLARAEWIYVFGVLLGKWESADSLFRRTEADYLALRREPAAGLSPEPGVFIGMSGPEAWHAGPSNSYLAHLVTDAGGDYLIRESSDGNIQVFPEQAVELAWQADWWGEIVFSSQFPTAAELRTNHPQLASSPPFREARLFACNAASTDYFGKAIFEPQVLLRDMIAILEQDAEWDGTYFQRVRE